MIATKLELETLEQLFKREGIEVILHLAFDRTKFRRYFKAASALNFAVCHALLAFENDNYSILIEKNGDVYNILYQHRD
jgi:hypothetical protein